MTHPDTFTLTEQHIKLVRAMYIEWCGEAYDGAPAVNIKRPYGNSHVAGDVAEITGAALSFDDDGNPDEKTTERMLKLHQETAIALQIILCTGCFEPGTYVRPERYDTRTWVAQG